MKALLQRCSCIFLYQKPINKYEHKPTPSQPKNNCKKLSETTSASIEKVKSER